MLIKGKVIKSQLPNMFIDKITYKIDKVGIPMNVMIPINVVFKKKFHRKIIPFINRFFTKKKSPINTKIIKQKFNKKKTKISYSLRFIKKFYKPLTKLKLKFYSIQNISKTNASLIQKFSIKKRFLQKPLTRKSFIRYHKYLLYNKF